MGSQSIEKVDIPTRTDITRLEVDSCCTDDVCVSSFKADDGHSVKEILRQQLCIAQETLAANHEHALVLLARGLATSQFRLHTDTDEESLRDAVRTALPLSATLQSRNFLGNATACAGSNLPGVPHSPGEPAPPAGVAPNLETAPGRKNPMPGSGADAPATLDCVVMLSSQESMGTCANLQKTTQHLLPVGTGNSNMCSADGHSCGTLLSVHGVNACHANATTLGANLGNMANPKPQARSDNVLSPIAATGTDTSQPDDRATASNAQVQLNHSRQNEVSAISGGSDQMYKFEVLPTWQKDKKLAAACQVRKLARQRGGPRLQATAERMSDDWNDETLGHEKGDNPCVIHPHSPGRFAWDLSSLILVTYDMAVIPLSFFDPPASFFLTFCAWITRLFWTFDIIASFLTGYLKADGTVEMHFVKIARRYILSWLLLDLMIVGIDWFEVLMSEMGSMSAARLVKSSRTIRIIRLVRLLRLVRMQTVLQQFAENIQSEVALVVLDIIKMIVLIMALAHLLACVWYGIGAVDRHDSWVKEYRYERLSLGYRYATSLHWSLSQFTGGMDEVTPVNLPERLYVIVVFLLSFIIAAVFVSHITSSMTRLHMITSHQSLQLSVLRKYFQQNKISKRLAARVLRNAKNAVAEKQRFMPESSVELLNLVSEPLRVELHFEMFSPILDVHDFFKIYIEECPQVMRKVCHLATAMSAVSPGDLVFNNGEMPAAPMMYFVVSGGLQYVSSSGCVHDVSPGEWVSEGTLWTPWMHRGDLEALRESRLCTIDAKKFQDIVCQFEHAGFDPKEHAAYFVRCLNTLEVEITDLDPVRLSALTKHTTVAPGVEESETEHWTPRSMFTVVTSRASHVLGLGQSVIGAPSSQLPSTAEHPQRPDS